MSCCYGDETMRGGGGVFKVHCCWLKEQDEVNKLQKKNPRTLFSMYIKFCRSYGEDKKDEAGENLSPGSKLSVKLEGEKDKPAEGNTRLYRAMCIFLTLLCLILLLVVIVLSLKLQTGSTACPQTLGDTCNYERCQTFFPSVPPHRLWEHKYICETSSIKPFVAPEDAACNLMTLMIPSKMYPAPDRRCQQCAEGWLTFGRSCFFLSTFRLNWDESQRNCSASGGSLAVISSRSLQNFLTKEGKLQYWIGLRQNSSTWTWVNNTALQQSFWTGTRSRGDCGVLSSGSPPEKNWFPAPCDTYTYFICQLQM